MEFRILGPLEVREGGSAIVPGVSKQRVLLGVLLLHANALRFAHPDSGVLVAFESPVPF